MLARELEDLLELGNLDVEFAFDSRDELFLLQVRPMVTAASSDDAAHEEGLRAIVSKVRSASRRHPHLRGRRTVFGVMPDWNPAEIVGTRPRPSRCRCTGG